MTASTGLVTESVETLAGALYSSRDVNLPMDDPLDVSCLDVAKALIASGAVRPAAEVRAESWDEGWLSGFSNCTGVTEDRPRVANPHRVALTEADR